MDIESNNKQECINNSNNSNSNNKIHNHNKNNNVTDDKLDYTNMLDNKNKFNNLIQINAEGLGIKSLDNDVMDFLNMELSVKLKEVLSNAKKFMRVSKRKTMKSDDINHALSVSNFKKIIGYDSYANVEFEKIDNLKGLWKQKQTVIDIDDYLGRPIANCAMDIFPHFHWIAIEGKRPNIAENFIREKRKQEEKSNNANQNNNDNNTNNINNNTNNIPNSSFTEHDKLGYTKTINNININYFNSNGNPNNNPNNTNNNTLTYQNNNYYNNLPLNEKTNIIQPVIHNITKELQIFLENFELRFRKEKKRIKLNEDSVLNNNNEINSKATLTISKELEITLNAIKIEPGIVELLPYILEFLMSTYSNKQNLKEPKIQLLIVFTLKAIVLNTYFNLSPYLHQIFSLLCSVVLLGNQKNFDENLILLKIESCELLCLLYKRIEFMYPEFIKQLLLVVDRCLILNPENPRLVSLFGGINLVNKLGPEFIIDILLPKIDDIIINLENLLFNSEDTLKQLLIAKYKLDININNNSNNNNENSNDNNNNKISNSFNNSLNDSQGRQLKNIFSSQINFSQTFNINNFNFDLLGSINTCNSNKILNEENIHNDVIENKVNKPNNNEYIYRMKKVLNGNNTIINNVSFIYYSLKNSAKQLVLYYQNFDFEKSIEITNKLTSLFGDDILLSKNADIKDSLGLEIVI